MSDEGGLQRLTEYLNQTRRQAESAIDTLNETIFELQTANAMLSKSNDELSMERSYLKDLVEQLQGENSRKWRLKERDDWKSLVDSVQADRVRLQEETMQLSLLLEEANAEINRQAALLSTFTASQCGVLSPDGVSTSRLRMSTDSDGDICGRDSTLDLIGGETSALERVGPVEASVSPERNLLRHQGSHRGSDSPFPSPPISPSQKGAQVQKNSQQLIIELDSTKKQRLVEKQIAETEIRGLKDEIERLHQQLQLARGEADADFDQPSPAHPILSSGPILDSKQPAATNHNQWSLSMGLWNYFFSPSNETSYEMQSGSTILRV